MKTRVFSFAIALIALFSFENVFAQSPKLHSPLTSQDLGNNLKVCYDISGLGNVDYITATLRYDVVVYSVCYNPGKDEGPVPGQSQTVPDNAEEVVIPVHNGRAIGCFTTQKSFSPGACPNSKWRGEVSDVSFSNIRLIVEGRTFRVPNP